MFLKQNKIKMHFQFTLPTGYLACPHLKPDLDNTLTASAKATGM